ncbi:MAG: DUF433 domain-containing protein [Flavobacteriales bacterium]|nr:hypothetical protein [Flavobacteriales bacterium]MCC6578055.1 DUF433 domain-containing protein [Flavobacteriales bacterium]NUQ16199.1 DUF433 domain-containing protein [Flavobacteriales bacterium]
MDWQQYITSDQGVLGGKPVIKGTRLAVELIQGRLADGWTTEMLLESYPSLQPEHIQAVHAFLLECMVDGMLMWPLKGNAE